MATILPAVALPAKVGEYVLFMAHGKQWHVSRLRRNVYFLAEAINPPRARFGTAKEIAADIGVVLECGALPRAAMGGA